MSDERRTILLTLARTAIEDALGAGGRLSHAAERESAWMDSETDPATGAQWLRSPGASFVTLTQRGCLRGCIGSLEARRALYSDVRANAVAAALRDPRFPPLAAAELRLTRVKVSLLSAPEPLAFDSEADALSQLRPGVDGILLEYGSLRSTFLPQVWEQLPRPEDFLSQLKRKAGLPGDFWHERLRLRRYGVDKFQEAAI
ncbi:AmmeMemoRadiSam system protein A [Malikia sp.]|uniref:AmmeMemoRadiSam system protein A n=1 Tax=Malikia sp. TaxID=2070706 RepID=UPI002618656D|nr:AmmeMemoRadiSam system protein A [Malikia sp.]MDD2729070.1 AmmeMemoRadiSam system protein A [Malikia sp.]